MGIPVLRSNDLGGMIGQSLGQGLSEGINQHYAKKRQGNFSRELYKYLGGPEEEEESFVNFQSQFEPQQQIANVATLAKLKQNQNATGPQIKSLSKAYGIEDKYLPEFEEALQGVPQKDINNVAKIAADNIGQQQDKEKVGEVYKGLVGFYKDILEKNPQRLERALSDKEAAHISSQLTAIIPYIRKQEFGGSARGIQMIQQIQNSLPRGGDRISVALEKLEGIGQGFGFDHSSLSDLKTQKPDFLGMKPKNIEEAKSQLKGKSFKDNNQKKGKESLEDIFG